MGSCGPRCGHTDTMADPVISNVETINTQDFESISEDVSHHRDDRDVVYMRLGVDGQSCPEKLSSAEQMETLIKESDEGESCNAFFSETKELIVHLKTHSRTSASSVQTEKKESTALKEGFYHPTLKRPKPIGVSGPSNKSEKMEPNKKSNTQY